jgi:type II secretory pathway component HofQ
MQELQALKAKEAQREAAALADQENSLKAEIAAFEKSEGIEFLADVRSDMAAILAKDFAKGDTTQAVLRDAYEKAVWQNPTTRARALEKESEKRIKQQQAEEQKRAAASGVNVRGAVNAGHPAINEDQMLSEVYRKVTARRN